MTRAHRRYRARRGAVQAAALVGVFVVLALLAAGLMWIALRGSPEPTAAEPSATGLRVTATQAGDLQNAEREATGAPDPGDEVAASARAYLLDDEPGRARAVLEAGIAAHPQHKGLRTVLGSLEMQEGKLDAAYAQFEAALAISPPDAETAFTAGTLAARLDRNERAHEHYAAAQRLDPANADYPLFLAQIQMRRGELQAASASLVRAGKLAPGRALVWGTLAEAELRQNRARVALEQVGRAIELEPREPIWRLIQARARNRVGEPERALDGLLALGATDRRSVDVMKVMAESYGLLQRPADAAAMYAAAADAMPTEASVWREAALWAERAGETDEALRRAKHAAMLGDEAAARIEARLGGG